MLNSSAPKFFQLSAAAALALALTACGGGDGGGNANSKSKLQTHLQPIAGEDAKLTAFSTAELTPIRIGLTKNSDGNEVLTLPGSNQQTQELTIESRDAEGNIKGIDSKHFSGITSLLGNRVGMLCIPKDDTKQPTSQGDSADDKWSTPWDQIGKYVFASDDLTPVTDPRELFGKIYNDYNSCEFSGTYGLDANGNGHTVSETYGENGPLGEFKSDPHDPQNDMTVNQFMELFTEAGNEYNEKSGTRIARTKAYKYTANGKTTYIYLGISATKGDATDKTSKAFLSISR